MSKLHLMMGCPGSGKSTWLASHAEPYKDKIVSRDEIRFSLVNPDEEYFSKENQVFNEFVRTINDNLALGYNVFADATHLNSASRLKLLRKITAEVDEIDVIWIKVPLKVALERNELREGRSYVPPTVIKNMFNSLQMPDFNEGIDKVYIVEEGLPIEVIERG